MAISPLHLDASLQAGSTMLGRQEEVSRGLELNVDGGLVGHPQVLLRGEQHGKEGVRTRPSPTVLPSPKLTLIVRRKVADCRDRRMFSGRENCCRMPPTDSTVEAWEYYGWGVAKGCQGVPRGGVSPHDPPISRVSPWGPAPPPLPACHAACSPASSASRQRTSPARPPPPPPHPLALGAGGCSGGGAVSSRPPLTPAADPAVSAPGGTASAPALRE